MRLGLFVVLLALVGCDAAAPDGPAAGPARAALGGQEAVTPHNVRTRLGTTRGTPRSALATADLSGTETDPAAALDLVPKAGRYQGVVAFRAAPGALAGATDLRLDLRTAGREGSGQPWQWEIYDACARAWAALGDRPTDTGGVWTDSSLDVPVAAACLTGPRGRTWVRVTTVGHDSLGVDYLALTDQPEGAEDWWQPAPGTSWQWQLSGTLDTSLDVAMYDLDLVDTPQATIDALHVDGRIVVCYFSAGSWEDWRPDAADFPASVRGRALDGWAGEQWLDIRDLATLGPIMEARLDLAAAKGCDGVEPDNVDGYANGSGFDLGYDDQLAYNRFLAAAAHARGLSVGLKNDLDQVPDLVADFDWALNEECFAYDECEVLLPFVAAGKAVFTVEYEGSLGSFCGRANAWDFDTLKKRLDLTAWRQSCR